MGIDSWEARWPPRTGCAISSLFGGRWEAVAFTHGSGLKKQSVPAVPTVVANVWATNANRDGMRKSMVTSTVEVLVGAH